MSGVRYDATKFNYIVRAASNVPVHMVWHTAKVTSIDDIKTREVVTGADGTGGTHNDLASCAERPDRDQVEGHRRLQGRR